MVGGQNLNMLLLMKKVITLLPKSVIFSHIEKKTGDTQIIWGNVVAHPLNDRIQNIKEEAKNC